MPTATGGGADINGRLIAAEISKQMGQQVVVDNRPGASNSIGFELIARAVPDGYTFGYAGFQFIMNPIMFAKLPYNTAKDFQPIVMQGLIPNLLAVTNSLQVRSVKELVAYARANPGKLSTGHNGVGGSIYLSGELFKAMAKANIVQVPYKGIQQALTDLMGGQIQMIIDAVGSILPHVKAEKLRPLGVSTLKRVSTIPDIPTIAEAGIPGYEMAASGGYVAPAGVSREVVRRLNDEINKALSSAAMIEKFNALGVTPVGGTPEQFAQHVRKETDKWAALVKSTGIKAE